MKHLRTYIAGLGSGGALVAAAIVALIALGGVVAVEGLPNSSNAASAEDVLVQSEVPGTDVTNLPPTDIGAQARGRGRIGNDTRSGPARGDSRDGRPGFGDTPVAAVPQPLPASDVSDHVPSLTLPVDPSFSPPHHPPHHNPRPPQPHPVPVPVPSQQGPLGGLVGVVNETVHGATGTDPHLPGTIAPVTSPIEEIIGGLTGGKGGIPHLP